jgi:hypothetical protein
MIDMIPPTDLPAVIVGEGGANGKPRGLQRLRLNVRGKRGNCESLVQLGGLEPPTSCSTVMPLIASFAFTCNYRECQRLKYQLFQQLKSIFLRSTDIIKVR